MVLPLLNPPPDQAEQEELEAQDVFSAKRYVQRLFADAIDDVMPQPTVNPSST